MINVEYELIREDDGKGKLKALNAISNLTRFSFDLEVRSIYSKVNRELAKTEIANGNNSYYLHNIASSSGLSHPSIVQITHIIIGVTDSFSYIFVCRTDTHVKFILNRLITMDANVIIHNTQFDMKHVYFNTGKFFKTYTDTMLKALVLINDSDTSNRSVGLKYLMGNYYDPTWDKDTDYEVEDLYNKYFIKYCAIDGASTILLDDILNDTIARTNKEEFDEKPN